MSPDDRPVDYWPTDPADRQRGTFVCPPGAAAPGVLHGRFEVETAGDGTVSLDFVEHGKRGSLRGTVRLTPRMRARLLALIGGGP